MTAANDLCAPTKSICKNYHNVIVNMYKEIDQQRELLYILLGKNDKEISTDDEHGNRRKRGLINIIGAAMHSLFGVCDDECTKTAEEAIKRNEEGSANMLHILKAQTTVVKTTIRKFNSYDTEIQRSLNHTREKEEQLYEAVKKTRNDTENLRTQVLISELHNIYTVLVNQFAFETTTLQQIVTAARGGVIHSSLLTPSDLSNVLKEIAQRLKARLSLPMGTRASELYELRKITKTSVYYSQNKIVFIIKIPLVTETELTLYNVIPVPLRSQEETSDKRLIIKIETPYAAITKDRKQYTVFTENQIQDCKDTAKFKVCTATQPVQETNSDQPCEIEMFSIPNKIPAKCTPNLITLKRGIYHKLRHRNEWIFSVYNDTITTSCTDIPEPQITRITGSGIIRIFDKNCQMFTRNAVLSTVDQISNTKYIDFVPKTDMSALCTRIPKQTHTVELKDWSGKTEMKLTNLNEVSHTIDDVEKMINLETERRARGSNPDTYWSYLAVVILMIALILIIIVYIHKEYFTKPERNQHIKVSTEVEEMQGLQVQEMQALQRYSQTRDLNKIYEEMSTQRAVPLIQTRPPSPL